MNISLSKELRQKLETEIAKQLEETLEASEEDTIEICHIWVEIKSEYILELEK